MWQTEALILKSDAGQRRCIEQPQGRKEDENELRAFDMMHVAGGVRCGCAGCTPRTNRRGGAHARSRRMGDKATLFVSNRLLDKLWALVDRNGKRENKVIASGLDRPNGLAFHKGTLYIA